MSLVKVDIVLADILLENPAHYVLFCLVQNFVEGAEYNTQSPSFEILIFFNLIGINIGILKQRDEYLIILLLHGVMKWSLPSPVPQIHVKDLPSKLLI